MSDQRMADHPVFEREINLSVEPVLFRLSRRITLPALVYCSAP
jgi:hypothetical protein